MSENSNSLTNYLQTRCITQQELKYNTTVHSQTLSQAQAHFQLITKLVQAYTGINQVTLKNSNSITFILVTHSRLMRDLIKIIDTSDDNDISS